MPTPDLLPTLNAMASCIAPGYCGPRPRELLHGPLLAANIYIPFPVTMVICLFLAGVLVGSILIAANLTTAVDMMLVSQEVQPDVLTRKIGRLSRFGRGLILIAIKLRQHDPAQHSQLARLATLLKSPATKDG
jgi:hypothetical protein